MSKTQAASKPDHVDNEDPLEESLLGYDDISNDPSIPLGNGVRSDRRLLTTIQKPLPEYVAGGLAGVSVVSTIFAMVVSQSGVIITSGILACGLGPYGYYQQTKLTDIEGLKETREKLEQEISMLKDSNERFHNELIELNETVNKLFEVEATFQKITEFQDLSVENLAVQVQENRKNLNMLEGLHRTLTLQNLLSVIVSSDNDNNNIIDTEEVDVLIKRIQDINGVELNEKRFREAVLGSGGSLSEVMTMIQNLMREGSDDSNLFTL